MLSTQSPDPAAVFGRFLDKQQRQEQFSENINKVIIGPSEGGYCSRGRSLRTPAQGPSRTRSPGLVAGAALALAGGSTPAEVHSEAHAQRKQAVEYARRRDSPFDDHTAFGAKAGELGSKPQYLPLHAANDARTVTHASQSLGKQNRELQRRVGAGAPWDAPEREPAASSSIAASGAIAQPQAFAEAQAEMLRNKQRMRGSQGLLAGDYPQTAAAAGSAARRSGGSLPPRPPAELLPEAHVGFQLRGGSVASLTHGKAAYLNSSVLADDSRLRNEGTTLLLG